MRFMWMGVRVLMVLLTTAYLLVFLLAILADHLIFLPHAPAYDLISLAHAARGSVIPFRVPCREGKLAAIYLPNPEAHFTLLYSHGNGEDIGDDLPVLEEFRQAGFAVFAYDYNGYGQSEGKPSEAAVYRDVEAAFDFLTGTLHIPPQQVIAFGHSLGAAAAIHVAAKRPAAGLIAESPFLSAFRVLTRVPILPWDEFNNAHTIRKVHCPVLIAHGRNDEVIPFWQGERIYELANQPKWRVWLEGVGHNDVMLVASDRFLAAIRKFADGLPMARSARLKLNR